MKMEKEDRHKKLRFRRRPAEHWQDSNEMHDVMHRLEGYVRALLLELLEKPMTREELRESLYRLERRMASHRARKIKTAKLDQDIDFAVAQGVLEEKEGRVFLTPGGREMAEHIQAVIPHFFEMILSPKTVAVVTISVHVLLSVLKLTFGLVSRSAGLFADGIDNTVDTVSAVLVWLGIRFDKEKLTSLFIVLMMFVCVGGIALACANKIVHPAPIQEGLAAFVISALCGLLMLLISTYQYVVGKRHGHFAILCQSVDSRNHFLTSLLVCGGIVLSYLAESFQAGWLYYADAAASFAIGIMILKSAVELTVELVKPGEEPTHVPHFAEKAQDRMKRNLVRSWLSEHLKDGPRSQEDLKAQFAREFCDETPKVLLLSGMGYRPESCEDLNKYLDQLVTRKILAFQDGKYALRK